MDEEDGIEMFSPTTSEMLFRRLVSEANVQDLILLENGELISSHNDGHIRRWDMRTGDLKAQSQSPFNTLGSIAASADGSVLVGAAFCEGLVQWCSRRSTEPTVFKEDVSDFGQIAVTPDGRMCLTGCTNGQVAVWDLIQGRRTATFEGHSGPVYAVVVTPDGRFAVSGSDDRAVRLWAMESGQCLAVLRGHNGPVLSIAITNDGRRIASCSLDSTLRIWDIPQAILDRADTAKKRGYMNAKVVLVGDSGVGKSGLALRLWHDRWEKTESTHGMEIQKLVLPSAEADPDVVREVWLWDLAGQPDYRLTHQLFMEQTALALLVFDPQDPKLFDTVSYWQNALGKVAKTELMPGILVAARCDRPSLRVTVDEIREWAEARALHGPVLTAAKLKTHAGVAELRALIEKLLPWDKMEFRSTMENFPALKDAILVVRDGKKKPGGVVVKPEELETRVRQAVPDLDFTPEDLRAVTGLLAGEGVLHQLPYGGLVVLQPSWVNCYASTLVKMAGEDKDHLGHVPMAIIQSGKLPADDGTPRLSAEDEKQLLPALVELFLKRALAWTQDTDRGPMMVFPSFVRRPRAEAPPRPGKTVVYRFTGPLEEIYCTLVVRLHYSGLFASTKLYRQAVDFQTVTGRLAALTMHEPDAEHGELEIYFGDKLDADVQAPFQKFVDDHLRPKAQGLERLRNFCCPKCGREAKDREALDALKAEGIKRTPCQYCFTTKKGVIDLNDVLERQFDSNAGEEAASKAGREASLKISTAAMEQVMVGEVMTLVASVNQIFVPRTVRDEGTDGEIEFISAAGESTGVAYRVQLKSGHSHLKPRKADGAEVFTLKPHYVRYWAGEKQTPVLLIIRTQDERTGASVTRFMNATKAIKAAQRASPGKKVTQIVFKGEELTQEAVLKLRDARVRK